MLFYSFFSFFFLRISINATVPPATATSKRVLLLDSKFLVPKAGLAPRGCALQSRRLACLHPPHKTHEVCGGRLTFKSYVFHYQNKRQPLGLSGCSGLAPRGFASLSRRGSRLHPPLAAAQTRSSPTYFIIKTKDSR